MKTLRTTTALFAFALLAAACGGSDDDDEKAADKVETPPGTYSCDIVSTTGHYCSGLTWDSGELTGEEEGWCAADQGSGTGYSESACPKPAVGCVCTYGMPETASSGAATGVQVFYFTGAQVATADAREDRYIESATWCVTLSFRLGTDGTTECFGLGAPYDGVH